MGPRSITANQLELSELSAQHPAWSWSQERRQKRPLWKYKFPLIYQVTQLIISKKKTSRFDVCLGRKKLAEQFVDNRWVEKLLSQFTGMSTGRKNRNKECILRSITELNNSLLRQLTRKFCYLTYCIIMNHRSCKTSNILSIYLTSVSKHQTTWALCLKPFFSCLVFLKYSLSHLTTSILQFTVSIKFVQCLGCHRRLKPEFKDRLSKAECDKRAGVKLGACWILTSENLVLS